jgi:hypothetical protein
LFFLYCVKIIFVFIAFRFLDFPSILLSQPEHNETSDTTILNFHIGKSILFQLQENTITNLLTSIPLYGILLSRSGMHCVMKGMTNIDLSVFSTEVILPCREAKR